jgi:hypothetical protein
MSQPAELSPRSLLRNRERTNSQFKDPTYSDSD